MYVCTVLFCLSYDGKISNNRNKEEKFLLQLLCVHKICILNKQMKNRIQISLFLHEFVIKRKKKGKKEKKFSMENLSTYFSVYFFILKNWKKKISHPDTIFFLFGRLVRSQKLYSIFIQQWQTSSIPHRYRKESIKKYIFIHGILCRFEHGNSRA